MTLLSLVERQAPAIKAALPSHIDNDRFRRIALTALRTNKKLQQCNPHSFLGALMTCAQLGLEPCTPLGHAYIIPYKTEAQFQLGYKGLLDLCYRTNRFEKIDAHSVYAEDEFEYELGLDPTLKHKPSSKRSGDPIAYYAFYKLKDGLPSFRVWFRGEIIDHAKKYSQSYNSKTSPWKTAFDAMAKKTVLKDLLRYAPMSPEDKNQAILMNANHSDNAVIKADVESLEVIETTFGDTKEIEQENTAVDEKTEKKNEALDEILEG